MFLNWPQTLSGIYPFFRPANLRNSSNRYNIRYFLDAQMYLVRFKWHRTGGYSLAEIIPVDSGWYPQDGAAVQPYVKQIDVIARPLERFANGT